MQRKSSFNKASPILSKTPQTKNIEPTKQPQPLNAKLLSQIGGGRGFPRGNW